MQISKFINYLSFLLFLFFLSSQSKSYTIILAEAERCKIVASHPQNGIGDTQWASGRKCTSYWGDKRGDKVIWRWYVKSPIQDAKLAIRYAYDEADRIKADGPQDTTRRLLLTIDYTTSAFLYFPDTHGWGDFETVYMDLPNLPVGFHEIALTVTVDKVMTNIDCFTIFKGVPENVLPLAFRKTVIARQTYPPIRVRMTPKCVVKWTPEQILQNFNRIYFWFKDFMGWEPDRPWIGVNIYEDSFNVGAHENGGGVHFGAENFNWDKGNWVHEMNHVFHNGYFPGFIDHPLIRTNDAFDSIDGAFPTHKTPERLALEQKTNLEILNKVFKNPYYRTDDLQEIIFAFRIKYGPQFTRRFYHELLEAGNRGEIPLKRGGPLYRHHMAKYLSKAAGEDVTPYLMRWNGWNKEL